MLIKFFNKRYLTDGFYYKDLEKNYLLKQIFFESSTNNIGFKIRFFLLAFPATIYGFSKGIYVSNDPFIKGVMSSSFAACGASICYPIAWLPLSITLLASSIISTKILFNK